jgi:hypothetical protein
MAVAAMLAAGAGSFGAFAQAQEQLKGEATELVLNPGGVGHMLVVPYFTTQNGNSTLVNIANATGTTKFVKVRLRGAANGDSLYDFQVFLRAYDMWTMNLSTGPDGIPFISTSDKSCTLPETINGQKLRTTRLNPALTGDALANHTREGYIEIINMADANLSERTGLLLALYGEWIIGDGIRYIPPTCAPSALYSLVRSDPQVSQPTTGLYAHWTIINVQQTTTWSGEATAWEARANGVASSGNQIYFPQKDKPLNGNEVAAFSADPLFNRDGGAPVIAAAESDLPDLSTPLISNWTPQAQANALSHTLAWTGLSLEHIVSPAISAATDFVLSMPTRRYYRAMKYATMQPVSNADTHGVSSAVYFKNTTLLRSYSSGYYPDFVPIDLSGFECEPLGDPFAVDRDATWLTWDGIVITGTPIPFDTACGAVGIVHVISGTAPPPPSSPLYASVTYTVSQGMARDGQYIYYHSDWTGQPEVSYGTPMIARSFMRAENMNARPGVSGSYGASFPGHIVRRGAPPPN